VESFDLWDFIMQHLAVILATVGLAIALIRLFSPRKAQSPVSGEHLSQAEIEQAEAAGQRARDNVRSRFGKHFGGNRT
jgi:hypothetical protein